MYIVVSVKRDEEKHWHSKSGGSAVDEEGGKGTGEKGEQGKRRIKHCIPSRAWSRFEKVS